MYRWITIPITTSATPIARPLYLSQRAQKVLRHMDFFLRCGMVSHSRPNKNPIARLANTDTVQTTGTLRSLTVKVPEAALAISSNLLHNNGLALPRRTFRIQRIISRVNDSTGARWCAQTTALPRGGD